MENNENPWNAELRNRFNCCYDRNGILKTLDGQKYHNSANTSDELFQLIIKYVKWDLANTFRLQKINIPSNSSPKSYIYISSNFYSNTDKALLLIQGSGRVRSGLWSRSVCVDNSLALGTMFPFLADAQSKNFSVIIFNPNKNFSKKRKIPQNENHTRHCRYVWNNFIRNCPARELYIVAHSMGGPSTTSLLHEYYDDFLARVKGIAFTDSVHDINGLNLSQKQFLLAKSVDWVASDLPSNALISKNASNGCINVSAGHPRHEYTTGSAYPFIFPFFESIGNGVNPYS